MFLFSKCLVQFLFSSGIIKLLDFPIFCGYYLEYCLFRGEGSFSFLFVFRYFVNGVCLFVYYTCLLSVYFGCAGSVGTSLAGRVIYLLCVCLRCVYCRAGTILFLHFLGADGGTVQIFSFSPALL
jgi:hypothetical protein